MKSSHQIRRIGILCLIISGIILALTLLSEAKAQDYWGRSSPVPVVTKGGIETFIPVSPMYIGCNSMSSRFFTVSAVAAVAGLLLIHRAKMVRRIDALESEIAAMRALVPRL